MQTEDIRSGPRQKFLSEPYLELNIVDIARSIDNKREGIVSRRARGNLDPVGQAGIFQDKLDLLKLYYTAGRSIDEIHPLYSDALAAFENWNEDYREYIKSIAMEDGEDLRTDGTPLRFEDLYDFQLALNMVSLGVLLGDGNAIRKFAKCVERFRGTDLLFESLIERAVTDPRDNTDFFHISPYDPLIDAYYTAETPKEASAKIKEYLDVWYKSFEGAPWHNGHLHAVEGEYMPYYGYWAFEAAAICVLYDIDDASFRDHLLYPKDLADWARANHSVDRLGPNAGASTAGSNASLRCEANQPCPKTGYPLSRLRCEAGQPCPQAGWWLTPAKANSRRHFNAGEIMPAFEDSSYGATIWQWDIDQSAPGN